MQMFNWPIVSVTSFSLKPAEIASEQRTTLTVGLANKDDIKSHRVRLVFSSHALVSFYIGDKPLESSISNWWLDITMFPSESRTHVITATARLDSGVSQITYRIKMTTNVDGSDSESKSQDLTVSKPP